METALSKKTCFVISPIGEDGTDIRKRADQVLRYIIREALEPRGYVVSRADDIAKPGSITTQVIESIWRSDLVIADLTDQNPNVFYELAVRHAMQRSIVHMIQGTQRIPFDIADFRTIYFDLDLDGAAKARRELCAQVDEVEAGATCVTPVSLAGILVQLSSSSSEDKVILRQLLEGFGELRAESRDLMKQLLDHVQKAAESATGSRVAARRVLFSEPASKRAPSDLTDLMRPMVLKASAPSKHHDALESIVERKQMEAKRREPE